MTPEEKAMLNTLVADTQRLREELYAHRHLGITDKTQRLAIGYAGEVASDGSTVLLPPGWSAVKDSTGTYTITHNIGDTRYAIVLTCSNDVLGIASVVSLAANSCQVKTYSSAASLADRQFTFVVLPVL